MRDADTTELRPWLRQAVPTTPAPAARPGALISPHPHLLRRPSDGGADPFRIVVVCTGNRFRSPLVAALIRRLTADVLVDVRSTGTMQVGPVAALPEAIAAAARLGVDLSEHVAQPATPDSLAEADLVLGFERTHVATCVIDLGVPREIAFTLPELAGLLKELPPVAAADPVERARATVGGAAELRRLDPDRRLAEISDPLGRPKADVAEIVEQLHTATTSVAGGLFGRVRADSPAFLRRRAG